MLRKRSSQKRSVPGIFPPNRTNERGQMQVRLNLPSSLLPLTKTVTTGVYATQTALDPVGTITNWASRFQLQFDEYRVMGIKVEIIPQFAANTGQPGVTAFWLSEISLTPTFTGAQERSEALWLQNDPRIDGRRRFLKWTPRDLDDQSFNACTASTNYAYFNAYTDGTNCFGNLTATAEYIVRFHFDIVLRGIKTI